MKKVLLALLLLSFVIMIYFSLSGDPRVVINKTPTQSFVEESNKRTSKVIEKISDVSSAAEDKGQKQLTVAQIEEKNDWLRANGFSYMFNTDGSIDHQKSPISDYDLYSLDALREMSSSDAMASLTLGLKLLREGEFIESEPLLYNSAIHGYGRAILELSKLYVQKAKMLKKGNERGVSDSLVEAYAWGQVINLRFYPDIREPSISGKNFMNEDELDDIKEEAKNRAHEIYSTLKLARKKAGMGDFDNYIPNTFKQ